MTNRLGPEWELKALRTMRNDLGLDAEKIPNTGRHDEGDIVVKVGGMPHILELKNEKSINLAGYLNEAEVERDNWEQARGFDGTSRLKAYFAAVIKRRNHSAKDAYVVMPLREWARLITDNDTPF